MNYEHIIEKRTRALILSFIIIAPLLRLSIPEMIRSGDFIYSALFMAPSLALIALFMQKKIIKNANVDRTPKRSFDAMLFLFVCTIFLTITIYAIFGVWTKSNIYQNLALRYLFNIVIDLKSLLVVALLVQTVFDRKKLSASKVRIFGILLIISFYLDMITGFRVLLVNFYMLPLMCLLFIKKGVVPALIGLVVALPMFSVLFYAANQAEQNFLTTLARFDMSIPLEIAMHHFPQNVIEAYPLENTYFPNMFRPILSLFSAVPETNPGREISSALGFRAENSYYAISVFGEAFLNFGNREPMAYFAVFCVYSVYLLLILFANFLDNAAIRLAVIISMASSLYLHGFEDYFAVKFVANVKFLLLAVLLLLLFKMFKVRKG